MSKGYPTRSTVVHMAALLGIIVIAWTLPVTAAESPPALRELDNAFVAVAEKVTPAVVNISSTKKISPGASGGDMEDFFKNHPFRDFFGDDFFKRFKKGPGGQGYSQRGMGSGVIVGPNGTILTNAHVVKDADEIKVNLSDKRSFTAKVIGADPESDIAVIKIDAKDLPIATLGDSTKLRVGEIVLAVGNPFGLNRTVTSGIISAKGRTNMGIIDYEDFIQTDAAINPGNSGGPLVNINGEVIGINTAIATRTGGYQGIGFAIPVNSAKLIMEDLMEHGQVKRGLLGVNIQSLDEYQAKYYGRQDTDGALVSQVVPGSPAEKAGVKDGDIIIEFNGKSVDGAPELKNIVGRVKPGTESTLTIIRDKKPIKVTVKVGERTPKSFAAIKPSEEADTSNELGIEVEPVPAGMAAKLGIKEGEGLRVKGVTGDGAGRNIGLREGDVILEVDGASVNNASEFTNAVAKAKNRKDGIIQLKVQRGSAKLFLAGPLT
ncbi:MAG: DegQ family serine endoprotease [Desulfomonilaceae bacterium]|nr:DegQ family serine endoprotease [Desulfomonilaceae bacterium]